MDHNKLQILGKRAVDKKFIGISTKLKLKPDSLSLDTRQEAKLHLLWQDFMSHIIKKLDRIV